MMYSYNIEQAIRAAALLHLGQTRKGRSRYPYVTHVFAVGCIVADYTDDEEVVIAALLHDTLEDTDYTPEDLELDFGPRVRAIVEGASEHVDRADARKRNDRKRAFVKRLHDVPLESLLVIAADKIHNLRSTVEEYTGMLSEYQNDFSGSLQDRLRYYGAIHSALNERLKNDIIHEFNHVFETYKTFLEEGS